MNEKSLLLKEIQAEDFALYETALYLDTHPTCALALEHYAQHQSAVMELKSQYERRFGPLTIYGNHDTACWNWVSDPWPWEKEAN